MIIEQDVLKDKTFIRLRQNTPALAGDEWLKEGLWRIPHAPCRRIPTEALA
jgi:hypothetical protein